MRKRTLFIGILALLLLSGCARGIKSANELKEQKDDEVPELVKDEAFQQHLESVQEDMKNELDGFDPEAILDEIHQDFGEQFKSFVENEEWLSAQVLAELVLEDTRLDDDLTQVFTAGQQVAEEELASISYEGVSLHDEYTEKRESYKAVKQILSDAHLSMNTKAAYYEILEGHYEELLNDLYVDLVDFKPKQKIDISQFQKDWKETRHINYQPIEDREGMDSIERSVMTNNQVDLMDAEIRLLLEQYAE